MRIVARKFASDHVLALGSLRYFINFIAMLMLIPQLMNLPNFGDMTAKSRSQTQHQHNHKR